MPVSAFKFICLFLLFSVATVKAQTVPSSSKELFTYLKNNDFDKLNALLDTSALVKFMANGYKLAYLTESESLGKLKKLLAVYDEPAGIKTRIALALEFKKGKKLFTVLYNQHQKIERYALEDYTETPFFQLKGYKGFSEVTNLTTEVKTRDGITLGANIAFGDTSKQKSPLVIFVHGSGPNDRDETIGPNKPFRDLAQGLAQQGIVSIRYDKRTFAYQYDTKLLNDSLTLYEETINDAIDAVKLARQFSFIDTTQIFIIGHSQGAMCAPKIAELCPKLKGIVMMAGPAGNIVDIIPEQIEYMALLNDTISAAEQMQINSVKWMMEKIKSPTLSNKTPKGMLMGVSATYWKSVLSYDQVQTAKKLTLPVLILNGERDYQVMPKEFAEWQKQLEGHKNISFKLYPKLNHLFLEGEGKPGPAEYEHPGHVPQYVIDDLVKFIKGS